MFYYVFYLNLISSLPNLGNNYLLLYIIYTDMSNKKLWKKLLCEEEKEEIRDDGR